MSVIVTQIQAVLQAEANAVTGLIPLMQQQHAALEKAVTLIVSNCGDGRPGRLVTLGIGKAGQIARKVAATFASTGTPSFFMHPAEARHGDLGMVQANDVILALSNSGSSEEITALLPSFIHIGTPIIALVGQGDSPLGKHAAVTLSIGKVIEACPLGLAPSASTTALLALGDALALTVQQQRHFTKEQYARFHPGGALGRKLMKTREAMRSGERVPAVAGNMSVADCMRAITKARSGSVLLVDNKNKLRGIFTDGDLRRALTRSDNPASVLSAPVEQYATIPCRSVGADELLQVALRLCAERKINEIPVIETDGTLAGLLDVQDLVDRGFEI
jgi:arabinose-5-phosphate isomerase